MLSWDLSIHASFRHFDIAACSVNLGIISDLECALGDALALVVKETM